MAVIQGTTRVSTGTAVGYRQWQVVADVSEATTGQTITLTITMTTSGLTPPSTPDTLTLTLKTDYNGTVVRTVALNTTAASQTVPIAITSTGVVGGAARSGTLEMVIRATRTSTGTYDVASDGTASTNLYQSDRGWVRCKTTWSIAASNFAGGAPPTKFAYGDTLYIMPTFTTPPIDTYPVLVTTSPTTSSAHNQTRNVTAGAATSSLNYGAVANGWAAGNQTYTITASAPNSSLTGSTWGADGSTVTSSQVDPTLTFAADPALTFANLLQVNDNTWGTPPSVKNIGTQRIASDLGFIAARVVNSRAEGQNGITWTTKLWDTGQLLGSLASPVKSRTVVSQTQGGQAGWADGFLVWDNALPSGSWTIRRDITAPSAAVGLESNKTTTLSLVASDPNLVLLTGIGPAADTLDGRHVTPGTPIITGLALFNVKTKKIVTADAGTPAVAVARFNVALGRAEFLDSDGVFKVATGASAVYYWPCAPSTGDPNTYVTVFSDTSTWGVADLFTVGYAEVGGVPVTNFMKEPVVTGLNNHTGYVFDGPGFVGFPTR